MRRWGSFLPGITLAVLVMTAARALAQGAVPTPAAIDTALARGDAAFQKQDFRAAAREYEAVLALAPDHPRALYRLGRIRRDEDPAAAVVLLDSYVAVQPRDAWGHLALADARARAGDAAAALVAYDAAQTLEPDEPDIALGRPRLLMILGRVDSAIGGYVNWLRSHPEDEDAWRELADARRRAGQWHGSAEALERALRLQPNQPRLARRLEAIRLRAAPAITGSFLGVAETDIRSTGFAIAADAPVGPASRIGGSYRRREVSSFGESAVAERLLVVTVARPRSHLQLDAHAGFTRLRPVSQRSETQHPEAGLRVRTAGVRRGPAFDLRAQHGPLDLTPELIAEPLLSTQLSGALDVPVVGGRWRIRGFTRTARLTHLDETNWRTSLGAGGAARVRQGVHVSGNWSRTRNSLPGAIGYFSPERAEVIDGGLDLERDFDSVSVSVDGGAGVQRVQKVNSPMGDWAPAFRLWAFVGWTILPGRQLLIEAEAYDSQIANVVATSEQWRQVSLTASLRLALARHRSAR
jgi:tetratricopeptide (TPR) repeat protein